jgi:hypothetical protein
MIRVGRRIYKGSSHTDPSFPGFSKILCLTASSPYGEISPYMLTTDKDGHIFENVWQFSKIYETVPYSKQYYSRYDNTVIWEHPSEIHIDDDGNPTEEYWNWREKGMACPYPVRYPVGIHYRTRCKYSLWEKEKGVFYELDYIEARKKIYLSGYIKCLENQPKFIELKERLAKGENLLIIETDGPHEESLSYYKEKYGVDDSFIENDTMLATEENLNVMLNDDRHPFGHGYCLSWALLGIQLN